MASVYLKRAGAGPVSGTWPDLHSLECRGVSSGAPLAGVGWTFRKVLKTVSWRSIHLGVLSEETETQKSVCNIFLIFKIRNILKCRE